jgi:hypothetical protein
MKQTEFIINNKTVSYKIKENGYEIYLNNQLWISQQEPYIPYPELGYEGSCLKQIEELSNTTTSEEQSDIEERVTSLEDMILEMSQVVYAE